MGLRAFVLVLVASLVACARIAMADDGGESATQADSGAGTSFGDAASAAPPTDGPSVDGVNVACDGDLCGTRVGAACAVANARPDRPYGICGLAVLGALGISRKRARLSARRRAGGHALKHGSGRAVN